MGSDDDLIQPELLVSFHTKKLPRESGNHVAIFGWHVHPHPLCGACMAHKLCCAS